MTLDKGKEVLGGGAKNLDIQWHVVLQTAPQYIHRYTGCLWYENFMGWLGM